jgi:hypothetical protein
MYNNKELILKTNRIGFVLSAVLVVALAKCVGDADGQSIKIMVPPPPVVVVQPPVLVVPPPVVAPVVVEDNYVYYPNYGIYYNSGRHQYAYLNGDAWVMAPTPRGVSVDVLMASPSVRMDFHDSPERHHAEMLQRYPRNWAPHDDHKDGHDQDHQDRDHDQKDRK